MTPSQAISIIAKLPQVKAEAKRNGIGVVSYLIQAPMEVIADVIAGNPVDLIVERVVPDRTKVNRDKFNAYWNAMKARKKLSKNAQADVVHNALSITAIAKRERVRTKVEELRAKKQEEERRYAELAGPLLLSKEEQRERMNREP